MCWSPIVGSGWRTLARGRSVSYSPAQEQRTPKASDVLYIGASAAPNTVDTMPEETLIAFGRARQLRDAIRETEEIAKQVLAAFGKAGIESLKLAADLQSEGAKSFDDSWKDLLSRSSPRAKH